MRPECRSFRALLERKLAGPVASASVAEAQLGGGPFGTLAWHEHLLACVACRELLAAEEALEILLATLPEPRLPDELARRVLSRLRAATDLDALLELDPGARAPEQLAARILEGLQRERGERKPVELELGKAAAAASSTASTIIDARLDALLERDRTIDAPAGLARRVLVALRDARRVGEPAPRAARPARAIRERLYAVAALLLAMLGAAWWWNATRSSSRSELRIGQELLPESVAGGVSETPTGTSHERSSAGAHAAPDAQMLAALDVLEQWDLLMHEDVDVLLSTIDQAEQILLEYQSEAPAPAPDPKAEPSKG